MAKKNHEIYKDLTDIIFEAYPDVHNKEIEPNILQIIKNKIDGYIKDNQVDKMGLQKFLQVIKPPPPKLSKNLKNDKEATNFFNILMLCLNEQSKIVPPHPQNLKETVDNIGIMDLATEKEEAANLAEDQEKSVNNTETIQLNELHQKITDAAITALFQEEVDKKFNDLYYAIKDVALQSIELLKSRTKNTDKIDALNRLSQYYIAPFAETNETEEALFSDQLTLLRNDGSTWLSQQEKTLVENLVKLRFTLGDKLKHIKLYAPNSPPNNATSGINRIIESTAVNTTPTLVEISPDFKKSINTALETIDSLYSKNKIDFLPIKKSFLNLTFTLRRILKPINAHQDIINIEEILKNINHNYPDPESLNLIQEQIEQLIVKITPIDGSKYIIDTLSAFNTHIVKFGEKNKPLSQINSQDIYNHNSTINKPNDKNETKKEATSNKSSKLINQDAISDEASKWINQDVNSIIIYDTPIEWQIVQEYIQEKQIDTGRSQKISRKDLKKFAQEKYPKIAHLINHSFLLFNQPGTNNFELGVLARSKSYTWHDNSVVKEGNLGTGSFAKVTPCKLRSSADLLKEQNPPKIVAIKIGADKNNPTIGDIGLEKINFDNLGFAYSYVFRERETTAKTAWTQGVKIRDKGYLKSQLFDENLYDYIQRMKNNNKQIPEKIKLKIALAAAEAIKKLHDKRILHRDIKPENLMLSLNGDNKLQIDTIDFGLSVKMPDNAKRIIQQEQMGTPDFIAQEITRKGKYSTSSDAFALGITLQELGVEENIYKMLTAEKPNDRTKIDDFIKELNKKIYAANDNTEANPEFYPATKKLLLNTAQQKDLTTIKNSITTQPTANNLAKIKKDCTNISQKLEQYQKIYLTDDYKDIIELFKQMSKADFIDNVTPISDSAQSSDSQLKQEIMANINQVIANFNNLVASNKDALHNNQSNDNTLTQDATVTQTADSINENVVDEGGIDDSPTVKEMLNKLQELGEITTDLIENLKSGKNNPIDFIDFIYNTTNFCEKYSEQLNITIYNDIITLLTNFLKQVHDQKTYSEKTYQELESFIKKQFKDHDAMTPSKEEAILRGGISIIRQALSLTIPYFNEAPNINKDSLPPKTSINTIKTTEEKTKSSVKLIEPVEKKMKTSAYATTKNEKDVLASSSIVGNNDTIIDQHSNSYPKTDNLNIIDDTTTPSNAVLQEFIDYSKSVLAQKEATAEYIKTAKNQSGEYFTVFFTALAKIIEDLEYYNQILHSATYTDIILKLKDFFEKANNPETDFFAAYDETIKPIASQELSGSNEPDKSFASNISFIVQALSDMTIMLRDTYKLPPNQESTIESTTSKIDQNTPLTTKTHPLNSSTLNKTSIPLKKTDAIATDTTMAHKKLDLARMQALDNFLQNKQPFITLKTQLEQYFTSTDGKKNTLDILNTLAKYDPLIEKDILHIINILPNKDNPVYTEDLQSLFGKIMRHFAHEDFADKLQNVFKDISPAARANAYIPTIDEIPNEKIIDIASKEIATNKKMLTDIVKSREDDNLKLLPEYRKLCQAQIDKVCALINKYESKLDTKFRAKYKQIVHKLQEINNPEEKTTLQRFQEIDSLKHTLEDLHAEFKAPDITKNNLQFQTYQLLLSTIGLNDKLLEIVEDPTNELTTKTENLTVQTAKLLANIKNLFIQFARLHSPDKYAIDALKNNVQTYKTQIMTLVKDLEAVAKEYDEQDIGEQINQQLCYVVEDLNVLAVYAEKLERISSTIKDKDLTKLLAKLAKEEPEYKNYAANTSFNFYMPIPDMAWLKNKLADIVYGIKNNLPTKPNIFGLASNNTHYLWNKITDKATMYFRHKPQVAAKTVQDAFANDPLNLHKIIQDVVKKDFAHEFSVKNSDTKLVVFKNEAPKKATITINNGKCTSKGIQYPCKLNGSQEAFLIMFKALKEARAKEANINLGKNANINKANNFITAFIEAFKTADGGINCKLKINFKPDNNTATFILQALKEKALSQPDGVNPDKLLASFGLQLVNDKLAFISRVDDTTVKKSDLAYNFAAFVGHELNTSVLLPGPKHKSSAS